MSHITKEEALDIARNNIGQLFQIKITDTWNEKWNVYSGRSLKNCWYITFSPQLTQTIAPQYLMVISKDTGDTIFSGLANDEG